MKKLVGTRVAENQLLRGSVDFLAQKFVCNTERNEVFAYIPSAARGVVWGCCAPLPQWGPGAKPREILRISSLEMAGNGCSNKIFHISNGEKLKLKDPIDHSQGSAFTSN